LGGELVKLEVRDLTGRGHPDVIVRRRVSVGDAKREYLEILDVPDASQEPRVTFAHEIAIEQSDRRVDNSVRMGRGEIDVSIEPATRWDALSYAEPTAGDVEPILLPWGPVRSQAWRWDGSRFVKAKAVTQRERGPQGAASAAAERVREFPERPAEPPTPTVERGGNLSSQVLESYRADRGVSASLAPKADLKVQVTGDARPERVLLIGRDLVVLGPGFKEGTGYLYTTLGQFTEPGDIKEVSARDVTGDGAADIIVRGERRLGEGPSSVTSEVMFVYTLQGDSLRRIFGIETGRERSKKRIQSLVQFVPSASGGSFDVLAAPGRAVGWTEKTYPFSRDVQDSEIEPLLLPWEAIRSVRYTWNGSQFIKSTTSP
jgi:hypothetical protein